MCVKLCMIFYSAGYNFSFCHKMFLCLGVKKPKSDQISIQIVMLYMTSVSSMEVVLPPAQNEVRAPMTNLTDRYCENTK